MCITKAVVSAHRHSAYLLMSPNLFTSLNTLNRHSNMSHHIDHSLQLYADWSPGPVSFVYFTLWVCRSQFDEQSKEFRCLVHQVQDNQAKCNSLKRREWKKRK